MNSEIDKIAKKINHIGELDVVKKIHSNNFDILKNHLSKYFTLKSVLPGDLISISYDAQVEKWTYINLLYQHISNYLSSANSLIDLTRKHYTRYYKEKNILTEYETQLKERFIESGLHNFVKDFRNYVLHYGIPPLSTTKNINYTNDNKVTHRIELVRKDLIESNFDWKKKSKDFINSEEWEEYRHLEDLFSSYFLKLNDFQVWYDKKQRELYIEDFNRINESNIEFQKKIVGDIIARIESGKGFTLKAIEHRLLGCFTLEQASEILKNTNREKTLLEMIERLKESDIIEEYSYSTLKNVLRK